MAALEIPQAVAAFRPVLQLVQAGLFLSLLLAVSVFDLKLRLIPDRLNLAIALTALLAFTPGNLFGVLGALPYLLVLLASRNGDGMGGGDVKLAAASGMVLGLPASLTASILGLGLLAIVCTIVTMIKRLLGETGRILFPAGPFLAVGAAAAYFMKLGGLIL